MRAVMMRAMLVRARRRWRMGRGEREREGTKRERKREKPPTPGRCHSPLQPSYWLDACVYQMEAERQRNTPSLTY